MGVKIKNLPDLSGLPETGDYFAITDESVTSKVDFDAVAEAILDDYTLTIGGASQTVKDAVDANATASSNNASAIAVLQLALASVETTDTTYSAAFGNYSTGGNPHFVKYGRLCMVYGTAKPTASITGGTDLNLMFTFPAGYVPMGRLLQLQAGSGTHVWLLTIQNGNAYFSRCRDGSSYVNAGTSEWLPFNAVYICE
ncbi:MAG: hypothetical protein IIZ10_02175 [Solobacterium sp.]|nr:hypothetical protein [Solobacterium sp.]